MQASDAGQIFQQVFRILRVKLAKKEKNIVPGKYVSENQVNFVMLEVYTDFEEKNAVSHLSLSC